MAVQPVSEATFIYLGMTKDRWPHITPQVIQSYLDEPELLDDDYPQEYVDSFWYYHHWFWQERLSK